MVGDLAGDVAQHEPLAFLHSAIADHDEIGIDLLGHVEDRRRRVAWAGIYVRWNANLGGAVGRGGEHRPGDVGLVDLPRLSGGRPRRCA